MHFTDKQDFIYAYVYYVALNMSNSPASRYGMKMGFVVPFHTD